MGHFCLYVAPNSNGRKQPLDQIPQQQARKRRDKRRADSSSTQPAGQILTGLGRVEEVEEQDHILQNRKAVCLLSYAVVQQLRH